MGRCYHSGAPRLQRETVMVSWVMLDVVTLPHAVWCQSVFRMKTQLSHLEGWKRVLQVWLPIPSNVCPNSQCPIEVSHNNCTKMVCVCH